MSFRTIHQINSDCDVIAELAIAHVLDAFSSALVLANIDKLREEPS